jgi:hypothetical protein
MASVTARRNDPEDRRIVSPASILILSAFLAGTAFAQTLPSSAQIQAVCAAAAGVAAYLGLWYTTRLQERLDAARHEVETARRLERRLGKHLRTRKSLVTGVTRRFRTQPGR